MPINKISVSIPIEFDKQDEGHDYHGPLTWKVMTTYYVEHGQNSYKIYGNKKVLTGPFKGTQIQEKELAENHFNNIKQYITSIKNIK
jgi:hypothetical protein